MTLDTDRKPREAIARALYALQPNVTLGRERSTMSATGSDRLIILSSDEWEEAPDRHETCLDQATAVLNLIRLRGWADLSLIEAIHAEEDANGEPRSSVVPGVGK